jgi:hypothetical protein
MTVHLEVAVERRALRAVGGVYPTRVRPVVAFDDHVE